jgi:hypothetical protein
VDFLDHPIAVFVFLLTPKHPAAISHHLGDGPLGAGPGQAAYAVPSSIVEDCVRMAERRAEEQR